MPVVVTIDFPNLTPEQYIKTHTDLMSGGRPDGMISHCCFEKNGGVSVIDIWESREKFDAFAKGKIAEVTQKHGIEGGPENLTMTELINADAFEYQGTVMSG